MIRDKLEIRFHGRGGQGAVTAAQILVEAALYEDKWGQAIPLFGAERRGAPVVAYARIAKRKLSYHSSVKSPDVVVVLDPYVVMVVNVFEGLKNGGVVVMNYHREPIEYASELSKAKASLCYVDATRIALKYGLVVAGWPVVNTAMLGALSKATSVVSIESIEKAITRRWRGGLGEANAMAARTAFNETKCLEV
ncbi:MAG: 2-oxoacid:acceptor oxidoreductase family protein [Pyrodictiaceae archaeon]